ncbi:hypothetical protein Gotri_024554, partial [Gossypium trilobum]|nr:hypothetical protein [Gossypium trilobum]
ETGLWVLNTLWGCVRFELWGILDGLTFLQYRGLNRILIQTDSLEVVHGLQRSISANSDSVLV